MDRPTLSLRGYALLTALLIGGLCAQALAADFQTGVEAFERGDFAAALDEWRPLAEQGDASAQYNLGWMYDYGEGVREDNVEAARWYRKAAEQGHDWAQYYLGTAYATGEGVQQDYAEAAKWYRMAAVQGHPRAQFWIGFRYATGGALPYIDVQRDDTKAVRWYRKAAEQGEVMAQFHLGLMCDMGRGVPENDVQAYAWYNIAAAQGHELGIGFKEIIAESMTREELARAQELSREYWKKYVLPFRN